MNRKPAKKAHSGKDEWTVLTTDIEQRWEKASFFAHLLCSQLKPKMELKLFFVMHAELQINADCYYVCIKKAPYHT